MGTPKVTSGTLSIGGLVGLQGNTRSHLLKGSARLGEFTHSSPTLSSQTNFSLPVLSEDGRERVSCTPFPGTRGWQSAPAPFHRCVTVGRSRLLAEQSGPLAARRIAAPPWPIQRASGVQFPPAQSALGPAPSARGSHPTTTQDPFTTIATHHPLCTDSHCWRALPGPPCANTYGCGVLVPSTGSASKVHCVLDAALRHNLESPVPPIPA